MSTAITYDQMECRAERALSVTLWAKHAKRTVVCMALLALLNQLVQGLVKTLSPDKLDALTREKTVELTKKLQGLHAQLVSLLTMPGIERAKSSIFLRGSLAKLEESTEDLGDIIEDLVLSEKEEFRSFVGECAQGLSSALPVGARGRM